MKPRANTQGARTKQKIVHAAIRLFARNGTHDVSIQKIAEECGLERALVAYHFPDKGRIFADAWNFVYAQALSETEARTNITGSNREKLENYFSISVEFFTSNRDITMLYFQLHYLAAFDESLREINTQVKQVAIQRIARILLDGQSGGEFRREIDPYLTAKMLHSSLVGLIINSITEFHTFSLRDLLASFTQQQMKAILVNVHA